MSVIIFPEPYLGSKTALARQNMLNRATLFRVYDEDKCADSQLEQSLVR